MVVNKESAKKVSEYVRKITMEWLNTGGSKQSALVNPKARYSFQAFCAENKLLEGATYRANDIVIACPFHDDESPSCSINEYKGVYNCFSCGRHKLSDKELLQYAIDNGIINTDDIVNRYS